MILFAILVFALDRAAKIWAYDVLRLMQNGTMPLTPRLENILHLTYAQNQGVSFGMLSGNATFVVILVAVLCLIIVLLLAYTRHKPFFIRMSGHMILGAALGNLYDRIRFGFVIDMVEIRLFRFAIFNVADAFLTIGAVTVMAYILFSKPASAPRRRNA